MLKIRAWLLDKLFKLENDVRPNTPDVRLTGVVVCPGIEVKSILSVVSFSIRTRRVGRDFERQTRAPLAQTESLSGFAHFPANKPPRKRNDMIRNLLLGLIISLGFTPAVQSADLLPAGSTWKYRLGTTEASNPVDAWRNVDFDDASWSSGAAPIGYGEADIQTTIPTSSAQNYTSLFLRKTFSVTNPADIRELDLSVTVDDGAVAWINGTEVGRINVPAGDLAFDATAIAAEERRTLDVSITNDLATLLHAGNNVVAIQAFNGNLTSSDLLLDASLSAMIDDVPPTVVTLNPPVNALIPTLNTIEVFFSEPVTNVDASDLLINGSPATDIDFLAPNQFLFIFPEPPTGTVQVAWAANHRIVDRASTPNAFTGGNWTYTLNPNAMPPGVIVSEFMADNSKTLNDEDGDQSDWIEMFNNGTTTANLGGWFLTDDPADLTKWRFPNVSLLANQYLVVFASGKNKTNAVGRLHTNFKLEKNGEYLALVDAETNIVSDFAPTFPQQRTDISYGRERGNANIVGFFPTATPGTANVASGAGFASDVHFSRDAGTFVDPITVALSVDDTNAVIHYTVNGTLPSQASPVYAGPIDISNTTQLRARAFQAGLLPGDPHSELYIKLDPGVLDFSSDLPIVILHNNGAGAVSASVDEFVMMEVFEPDGGRSSLTNSPDLSTRARFKLRGSSTCELSEGQLRFRSLERIRRRQRHPPPGHAGRVGLGLLRAQQL